MVTTSDDDFMISLAPLTHGARPQCQAQGSGVWTLAARHNTGGLRWGSGTGTSVLGGAKPVRPLGLDGFARGVVPESRA